jgi:hypothetical protein
MGTDIHGVFQRRDGNRWVDVASKFDENRHYQLFAVLAGVRNGYGFAGITTGEPVRPIAQPRGLPSDFAMDGDSHPVATLELMGCMGKYHQESEPLEVWMGDHSHSWLTADEMLAWAEHAPVVTKTGILSRDEYAQWDGTEEPGNYCGGISGRDIVIVNDNAVERERAAWTHIRCHWESSLRAELSYFFDEVARLKAAHGDVRYVFGFDS